jgi:hypothetical protein
VKRVGRQLVLVMLCAGLSVLCAGAYGAEPPPTDPLFTLYASEDKEGEDGKPYPAPGGFEGPCGLTVDASGNSYVSDYYHDNVDAFAAAPKFFGLQLAEEEPRVGPKNEPLNGPCALAVDSTGNFYVNNFHRNVERYSLSPFPVTGATKFGPINSEKKVEGTVIDSAHSTGVAVDSSTGNVYVDDRTYIAVYEPSGAPVEVGGEPLRIGEGSLLDGYGVAVSNFLGTTGRVYVPDAGDDTVKVYDPGLDTENPIGIIDGHETPKGEFVSLRDAAIAIDQSKGRVYVSDDLLPEFFEEPEAAIYAFESSGTYAGRLKKNILDARPLGLAVDNSETPTQGRVYVTSGNSEGAAVYAFGPNAVIKTPGECAKGGPCPLQGTGGGSTPSAPPAQLSTLEPRSPSTASSRSKRSTGGGAAIAQRGNLRVIVNGRLSPHVLPRRGTAPVAVSVAGRIATTDGSTPPQLQTLRIEINRHGQLDYAGLPVCPYERIQPASSARALAACRSSLVGQGHFQASVTIAGQEPYAATGRLLVFNGRLHGHSALLGQIYAPRPFANSFVIVFAVHHLAHGSFGTALVATLPSALGGWGHVTGIEMKLGRRFFAHGASHSYISAGCPAPSGFTGASFPLARASFGFAGGLRLAPTLVRSCAVR